MHFWILLARLYFLAVGLNVFQPAASKDIIELHNARKCVKQNQREVVKMMCGGVYGRTFVLTGDLFIGKMKSNHTNACWFENHNLRLDCHTRQPGIIHCREFSVCTFNVDLPPLPEGCDNTLYPGPNYIFVKYFCLPRTGVKSNICGSLHRAAEIIYVHSPGYPEWTSSMPCQGDVTSHDHSHIDINILDFQPETIQGTATPDCTHQITFTVNGKVTTVCSKPRKALDRIKSLKFVNTGELSTTIHIKVVQLIGKGKKARPLRARLWMVITAAPRDKMPGLVPMTIKCGPSVETSTQGTSSVSQTDDAVTLEMNFKVPNAQRSSSSSALATVPMGLIVGCIVGWLLLLLLVGLAAIFFIKRKKSKKKKARQDLSDGRPFGINQNNHKGSECAAGPYAYADVTAKGMINKEVYGGSQIMYAEISDMGTVSSGIRSLSGSSLNSVPPSPPGDAVYYDIEDTARAPAPPGGHPTMLNSGPVDSFDPYAEILDPRQTRSEHLNKNMNAHSPDVKRRWFWNSKKSKVKGASNTDQKSAEQISPDPSLLYSKPIKQKNNSNRNDGISVSTWESENAKPDEDTKSMDLSLLYAQPNKSRPPSPAPSDSEEKGEEETPPPLPPKDDSLMDPENFDQDAVMIY